MIPLEVGTVSFTRRLRSTARSSPIIVEVDDELACTLCILRRHPNPGRTSHETITSAQSADAEEILDPLAFCDVSNPHPIQRRPRQSKKRKIRRLENRDEVAHTTFASHEAWCRCGATLYGSQTQFYHRGRAPAASRAC